MKKYLGILASLLCLALIVAVSLSGASTSSTSKAHINPGSPKAPVRPSDWFKAGKKDAENPSLSDVLKRVKYSVLLRSDGKQLITPIRIFVQPQVVSPDGDKVVEGFSFRYGDHIQLMVDPASKPLDIQESLLMEQKPDIKGLTRPYFKIGVRNLDGVGRETGVQKWESGAENRYPSVVQWTEQGDGEAPYLLYTIMGDCPVSELQKIAASLVRVDKK